MTKLQNPKYDLEERTAEFGENVIRFCQSLPRSTITTPLIDQLIRSATSCGANYYEADDAVSKKDFKNKIGISKKEARESKYFLRMIAVAVPESASSSKILLQEAKELNLILNAIYQKII